MDAAHNSGGRTVTVPPPPSSCPGPTVAPARQRLFVQSARRAAQRPQQSQLAPRARPSSANVWATSSVSRAEHKQRNTRPRSSRERNHGTGSSNRQVVFGRGSTPRPQSVGSSSSSDAIIGERRTKTFIREAISARTESTRRRQRRKVPGYETNKHRVKIGNDKAAALNVTTSSSATVAAPAAVQHDRTTAASSTCTAVVPRPYQRKEDVNLIRRVAEKLASLGPAQAKYRNNLQGLEAKSSNPDKLLSRQQLCEGFVRFGFHKEEIERLYDMFAETRKAQACGGVKVLDFLDFFEYFTPLDRLTGQDENSIDIATPVAINEESDDFTEKKRGKGNRAVSYAGPQPSVQSSAPWNRPQSLRPTVRDVPDHSFSDMVSPEALSSDTARAFDVHLLNIVRDLLYHKDNIFRTAFRKMDVNRDGRISRPEFRSSLKEMGLNLRQSSRLAEIIDADANDEIDYNEFLAAFEGYNPIERAAAFKEKHTMRGAHKAGHAEMVESVRSFLCVDDGSYGEYEAPHGQQEEDEQQRSRTKTSSSLTSTAGQCFEVLSGKLREREATILHALKLKDVDNNGIIPATSAIDAIIGTVPSLEAYRGEVGAFVDTVSSETGNVRYREMLRVFKDADSGLSVSRGAQHEKGYRQPNLLNSMRPSPSPSLAMTRPMSAPTTVSAVYRGGGGGATGDAVSCDAIEKQQEAYLASRRRLLLHKAAKPQHHRRRYDCTQRLGPSSTLSSGTTTVSNMADPHWFDVVYGPERRVGRFASTPDSSTLRRMI